MFGILTHKISGIYEIVNTTNGKRYIGSSVDIKVRWRDHQNCLQGGRHHNKHLQAVWNKYGKDCFRFSIIEQCEKYLLIEREQFYIDTLRPEYNKAPNAGSSLGRGCSEETRLKISNANKGGAVSEETRRHISEANKGRTASQETRRRISVANKGRTFSEEHRRKLSEIAKQRCLSKERIAELSEISKRKTIWNKGKTGVYSEETLRKMSEVKKGTTSWNKGKKYKLKDKE